MNGKVIVFGMIVGVTAPRLNVNLLSERADIGAERISVGMELAEMPDLHSDAYEALNAVGHAAIVAPSSSTSTGHFTGWR